VAAVVRMRPVLPFSSNVAPAAADDAHVRRCSRCGCRISRYADAADLYCAPCHPEVEEHAADPGTCTRGHDLAAYGRKRPGRITPDCIACERERQAAHRARRRAEALAA
jgi:hypothetical protein